MKKRIVTFVLAVLMLVTMVPVKLAVVAHAKSYSVPITSYQAFRNATYGNGYDIDGYYSYQCWDGAALLWQQLGMSLITGNGRARGCWELKRTENAGSQFDLIYNKNDIKRGDIVVFGMNNEYGHIAFADADYSGNTLTIFGQNQGGDGSGAPFSTINVSLSTFLGAFRYKGWATHTHMWTTRVIGATEHWLECDCGATSAREAHIFGNWKTSKEPTCTTDGSKYHICTVCGAKRTETIPATGHSYGTAWKSDGSNHWHVCSCGAKSGKTAHTYGSWKTSTAATHTTSGSKYRTCTVCGYKQTETIPATGHSYGTAWKYDATNHWHECSCGAKSSTAAHQFGDWETVTPATKKASGLQKRTCRVCGWEEKKTITILDHSDTGEGTGTTGKLPTINDFIGILQQISTSLMNIRNLLQQVTSILNSLSSIFSRLNLSRM